MGQMAARGVGVLTPTVTCSMSLGIAGSVVIIVVVVAGAVVVVACADIAEPRSRALFSAGLPP